MLEMVRESIEAMDKDNLIRYFESLAQVFYAYGTPDTLQGGIGIIRYPHKYSLKTLSYWYNECKRAGY